MSRPLYRWMPVILLTALGSASATPALPAPSLAAQAVRDALLPEAPVATHPAASGQAAPAPRVAQMPVQAPRVVQATPPAARSQTARAQATQAQAAQVQAAQAQAARAAQARAQAVQQAQAAARGTVRTGRSAVVRATAYNSLAAQTDSTPFITATGTRTRPGVVALSRDLLRLFPYGSKIMIEDLSGRYNNLLRGRVFSVEDTMAARKRNSLDIWMGAHSQAIQFGARQVRITAVR